MSKIIISKNHISLTSVTEVNAICEPLFTNSLIYKFAWLRMYDNGEAQLLFNDTELGMYHVNVKNNPLCPQIDDKLIKNKFYYFSLPSLNDRYDNILCDFKQRFCIHHPIYLIERYTGYYEAFWFASRKDDIGLINYYLNNMSLLESFKFYFKEKAAKLIEKNDKNKFFVPEKMRSNLRGKNLTKSLNLPDVLFHAKHYQIDLENNCFILSRREMEVIQWIARGRTMKEVANLLQISQRTAEQYFNNAKTKSGLSKKSQLVDSVLQSYLSDTGILEG